MREECHKGKLMNIFDDMFEEARIEYNKMPEEYRKGVSLHEHQENYVRESAQTRLNKH